MLRHALSLPSLVLRSRSATPADLFRDGELGVWSAPLDPSSANMWTDTARTTPVTQLGDTVRSFRLLTANSEIYATNTGGWVIGQDSGGKYYLQGSGTSAFVTPAIDFTTSDEMFVCVGVRKLTDTATSLIVEFSSDLNTNTGSFYLAAPLSSTGNSYGFASKGTVSAVPPATGFAAPHSAVLTGYSDISGDTANLRVNGTLAGGRTTDQGTGNFGNYPLYIGGRGNSSLFFGGRFYGLVVRAKTPIADTFTIAEAWVRPGE